LPHGGRSRLEWSLLTTRLPVASLQWLDKPVSTGGMDDEGGSKPRDETCLMQIWVECLGSDLKTYNQQAAQTLGRAMRLVPGWFCWGERHAFDAQPYGRQRLYYRGDEHGYRVKMGLAAE
jgi:hypothetical protein